MNSRFPQWLVLWLLATLPAWADTGRDRPFDSEWRFLRADAPGAEVPDFNDADWRVLDVPHDWSIEDLPLEHEPVPFFSVVPGKWRFRMGDDATWKGPYLNDNEWQEVTLPDNWEHHSNYTNDNVYGWYRRHLPLPPACAGKEVELLLGLVDDVDETYLNGVRIGGTGSFPPEFKTAFDVQRRYRVPAGVVHADGTDVLAVRVFDGTGNGGIYAEGTPDAPIGPFDAAASPGGASTGHVLGGTGWYRKHFALGVADAGKQVSIYFDGVYMDSDVWLNGQHLGNHPYGYTGFEFNLTPHLKAPGQDNVLAVRVRNEGKNSRWYSGSGIFRHVTLAVTDPVRVPLWGVYVRAPEVTGDKAKVQLSVEIKSDRTSDTTVRVHARLIDPKGKTLKLPDQTASVRASATASIDQAFEISSPRLWSLVTPDLYRAEIDLLVDGKTVDHTSTSFGLRRLEFDVDHGFRLNGEVVKLKGGCLHHDNGPLGSAAIDRAEERRVELMKANGFNAIRTSHNPPSSVFLEACDRLGILVIDEAFDQWEEPKNPQDYHRFFKEWSGRDIAAMVRRDRNHPSVIIWSIGNEVHDRFDRPDLAKQLREQVLTHDQTRPITAAICGLWDHPNREWEKISDAAFQHLDIGGYNYLPEKYEPDHARNPRRVMVCTESYPKDCFEYWASVERHPYVIGDFVWTGMDYLGESGIGHSLLEDVKDDFLRPWPWFDAYCGDLDICGFKKPQSYYRDVVWNRSLLEVAVHSPIPPGRHERVSAWGWPDEIRSWNWPVPEGTPLQVSVCSRAETVRLELNHKLVGEKRVTSGSRATTKFDVPYAPGELTASALVRGKVVAVTSVRTTGKGKKLSLNADRLKIRSSRNDLAYVTVEVHDQADNLVPDAVVPVQFSIEGEGELAAVGSGNPSDATSFRVPLRTTFQGRGLAILRPTGTPGKMTLKAEAPGLLPATLKLQTQ